MKYFLFIAFCSSLFFQVACKKKEPKMFEEMTISEMKKWIKKNREYETVKGCKVVAFDETATPIIFRDYTPAVELLREDWSARREANPLLRSTLLGELESVKCLLKADFDPNVSTATYFGRSHTALFEAVVGDSPKIVEALVKAGADVNEIDATTGKSFILKTAEDLARREEGDFKEIIKILKAHGAK